ncbi:MAG TPA: leucyl/phenylalanyl-tRNA--protein transferase [Flavobacteriaceae bacterium]|nr:leucyl/phenylalanyl-tRNA--protein transferase [Flavobacteriaceae bacterium]
MQRNSKYNFPNPAFADEEGLLAVGGDLHPERLLEAYYSGIFPWYGENQPLLWWSPDPRMVLFPENLKVSKSMRKLFRRNSFQVTYNQDFERVMQNCADIYRPGQEGTWIMPEMIEAYTKLHQMGYAYSVEVWKKKELVGGLYGIFLKDKKVFCGESMFTKESNASKYGFISLVKKLKAKGVELIDCQIYSEHLESLGAEEIPRTEFLKYLK